MRSELFGETVRLVGARVDSAVLTAGGVLTAQLAWKRGLARPGAGDELAVTLQLLDPDGVLVAQADLPLEANPGPTRSHYGILLPEVLTKGTTG